MKKIFISLFVGLMFLPIITSAANPLSVWPKAPSLIYPQAGQEKYNLSRIYNSNFKTVTDYGRRLAGERYLALKNLRDRLANDSAPRVKPTGLNDEQKGFLIVMLDNEIEQINNLTDKLIASNSLEEARQTISDILSRRDLSILTPKINALISIYALQNYSVEVNNFLDNLSYDIDNGIYSEKYRVNVNKVKNNLAQADSLLTQLLNQALALNISDVDYASVTGELRRGIVMSEKKLRSKN